MCGSSRLFPSGKCAPFATVGVKLLCCPLGEITRLLETVDQNSSKTLGVMCFRHSYFECHVMTCNQLDLVLKTGSYHRRR